MVILDCSEFQSVWDIGGPVTNPSLQNNSQAIGVYLLKIKRYYLIINVFYKYFVYLFTSIQGVERLSKVLAAQSGGPKFRSPALQGQRQVDPGSFLATSLGETFVPGSGSILFTFPVCDKIFCRDQQKVAFTLAYSSRLQSIVLGISWQQDQEDWAMAVSSVQRTFSLYSVHGPRLGNGAAYSG